MLHTLAVWLGRLPEVLSQFLAAIFWSAGTLSLVASFATSLLVAVGFLLWRRHLGHRHALGLAVWRRAMFPRRWLAGPSAKADIGIYLFNTATYTVLFGWLMFSGLAVARFVNAPFAPAHPAPVSVTYPGHIQYGLISLALFLGYEFGYWLHHYLMHRFDFLWPFHKVHHTAETLSPLTNFRMHPVDSVLFGNVLSLVMGATYGVACGVLKTPVDATVLAQGSAISLLFVFTISPLQHSHVWMPVRGLWGRIILSPAHHQLHHSADPADFNSNYGSNLSLFDTLFGTLNMPSGQRPKLTFGVTPVPPRPHSLTGWLIVPFGEAAAAVRGRLVARQPAALAAENTGATETLVPIDAV